MPSNRESDFRLPLTIDGAAVRPWHLDDLGSLVHHANNAAIADQLRDRFPHPYGMENGRGFLEWTLQQPVVSAWALDVGGAAVGGIALQFGQDIERVSAEIGYWLGEEFWGRGLTTAAVLAVTDYAFEHFGLTRIFAVPFANNAASIRILEKAGYAIEGHLRRSAIKNGVVCDQRLYARYR